VKFLFVMDPIERVDVTKDTTFAFAAESQSRGHENHYCNIRDLLVHEGKLHALTAPVTVKPVQGQHYTLDKRRFHAAESFDCIFMRKDPPFDTDFFYATHLLSLVDRKKTFVFNDPHGLREATEKLFILHFPDLIPETIVASDPAQLLAFADKVGGDIVVKPLDGCGGANVFRISKGDLNTHPILEMMTREGTRQVMAQRFLPESRQGDLRLIYLDGRALGGVLRVPRADDLRGNIHVGGTCVAAKIGSRERQICQRLAPSLSRLGIFFAGLDIIGGKLTEVNVTSPTGIHEINRLDQTRLEVDVIDFVEKKVTDLER
jgi:glutathione synthase